MARIFVCLSALLLLVNAGTLPSVNIYDNALYDENSKAFYRVHSEPATWLTAYTTCIEEGGQLTMVDYKNSEFLLSHYPPGAARVFVGLSEWQTEEWHTIEGASVPNTGWEWNGDEPDNKGGDQRCGIIYKYGKFGDRECLDKNPFICQINVFPQEYTYFEGTKTYYKFHVKPTTWFSAYTTCVEEGGRLAVINSNDEASYFRLNFPLNANNVFLGFQNWEDGSWKTIHGEALSEAGYEKWAKGEPVYEQRTPRCGIMHRSGYFNDEKCDTMLPFICEKIEKPTEINRNKDTDSTGTIIDYETTPPGLRTDDWTTPDSDSTGMIIDYETTPPDSKMDDLTTIDSDSTGTIIDYETTPPDSIMYDWTTTDTDSTGTIIDYETTPPRSRMDDWTTTDTARTGNIIGYKNMTTPPGSRKHDWITTDVNTLPPCVDSPHYRKICKQGSQDDCLHETYRKMCCKSCSKLQGI